MCGIIVAKQETKRVRENIKPFIKRGPDQQKMLSVDSSLFVFNRLAIMGLSEQGMQPFELNGDVLVCNGEIYNYAQIKTELQNKYTFKSSSDCEVLLPLYQEIGLDMFSLLDAEFAIVLYDKKTSSLVAGRDPIGIRPLYYGYDSETNQILFSSEVKGIIDLVANVFPFPPGHYYSKGEFIKYSNLLDVIEYSEDSIDGIAKNIHDKLTLAVKKRLSSDAPIGYLLSGGLDSSLVCSIAQKFSKTPIRTFSIGMIDDPIDLKYAKIVSDYLGTNHTEIRISKQDVLEHIEEVIIAFETYDITTIRAGIGMYLLAKYIHNNTDIKVLLTGEVSDELFGYKYTDFAPNSTEFQMESIKRVHELHMYDVLRADRALASNSLEARVPFGDIDFVNYVLRINPDIKMNRYNMGKYLLREAFKHEYLPDNILYRDKAAFSDAVGHSLVDYIKEFAETKYTDKEFHLGTSKYDRILPFTKEALLYMDLFQKHFPNQEHLVKDYWMPNKKWQGCNVMDPSARVLSNYGKSGE